MNNLHDEPYGVLAVNKPSGMTSHDVVNVARRALGTKQIGHTGTLDPMATGVLVLLVGRAAKASEYAVCHTKTYRAVFRLGLTTDTEDVTGKVLSECGSLPEPADVVACAESFCGDIMQVPPMYSAIKCGGRKLCDVARAGGVVEREPRSVHIYEISAEHIGGADYALRVTCSAGTYIRTLCADIGAKLGCGGVMAALCRTSVGDFAIENTLSVEELKTLPKEEIEKHFTDVERLFFDLGKIRLNAFFEKLFRSGCEIYLKKIGITATVGRRFRVCDENGEFFAIAEVREYAGGAAIKSLKLFVL